MTVTPEVEWSTLKSQFTPYLDYRHICAYEPKIDCPNCPPWEEWK